MPALENIKAPDRKRRAGEYVRAAEICGLGPVKTMERGERGSLGWGAMLLEIWDECRDGARGGAGAIRVSEQMRGQTRGGRSLSISERVRGRTRRAGRQLCNQHISE